MGKWSAYNKFLWTSVHTAAAGKPRIFMHNAMRPGTMNCANLWIDDCGGRYWKQSNVWNGLMERSGCYYKEEYKSIK